MAAGDGLGVLRTLRHYGFPSGSRRPISAPRADFAAAIRASVEELRAAAA